MPLRRFLPYDIIGAGLWGTTFCVLGYVFWQSFGTVARYAGRGALALGTVIVVIVGVVTTYRWLRVPANRQAARRWLHEQAERPALRPLARVVRPIVYRGIAPVLRRLVGPARFTLARLTPGELGLEVTTLFAVACVGSFAFTALAFSVGPGDPPLFSDRRAFEIAHDLRVDWLVDVAKMVTTLGSMWVVGPLCVAATAVLVAWRRWAPAIALVAGTVLVVVADQIAKAIVDRPRPPGSLVETSGASYPSGHAAQSIAWIAVAVLLLRFVPWLAGRAVVVIVAIGIAIAIGLSRVYLDAHYLSDVIGGWGLGATIYAVCGIVAMVVAHSRHNRAVR
jgi:undecaprenyl-diphosphatase